MDHICRNVEMVKRFEALVVEDKRSEIVVLRRFALVCSGLKTKLQSQGPELNHKLLDAVNSNSGGFHFALRRLWSVDGVVCRL